MAVRRRVGFLIVALGVFGVPLERESMRAADNDARVARAAERDDAAAVRALVRQRADVNGATGDGSTALLWAAHWNNLDIVRALLQAGAKVASANRLGVTPLLEASRLGSAPVIEVLLAAGAAPNVEGPDGETPLMAAAESGSVDAVQLLIRSGAVVNAKESWQEQTPLMWAAAEGHLDVVNVLLEAGANPSFFGKPSSLIHHDGGFAGGRGFTDHSSRGLTAVMLAARQGHAEVVRRLARAGADLAHANPDGVTALMIAIINSRFDVAAVLLDEGADANDGSLYQAVEMHNMAPIVTATDATRPRPYHENALTSLDLIQRLLDRGADPNKLFNGQLHFGGSGRPGATNASAIVRAAQSGDVAAIRLMVAKGADVNRPDQIVLAAQGGLGGPPAAGANAGLTPVMVAMGGGGGGRGGFGGRGGPAQFREPSERNAMAAVTALLDAPGADVNARAATTGETALHRAAQTGNVPMIQLLADRGATLDARNQAGFTALDLAMGKGAPPAPRGGGGGGGFARGGGPAGPQPNAVVLLRQLMGLPALSPDEMPRTAPPARGDFPPI